MTVVWSGGADIKQSVSGASFNFKILDIPAGSGQVAGQGVFAIALAMSILPLPNTTTSTEPSLTLTVYDDLSNSVLSLGADDAASWIEINLVPSTGGSVWLSGFYTGTTTAVINGVVVVCIDDSSFDPTERVGRDGFARETGTTPTGTIFRSAGTAIDLIFALAAGLTTATTPGYVDFTGASNWTNVIQRFLAYTSCASNSNIPGSVITSSPQVWVLWSSGTLPTGATSITGLVELGESGFGVNFPQLQARVQVLNSGGAVIATYPVFTLPAGGGLIGWNWSMPVPSGADSIQIVTTWASTPSAGVTPSVAWQLLIYCNNDGPYSYSVGIGQYTADANPSGAPYQIAYPPAVNDTWWIPGTTQPAGFWQISELVHTASGVPSWGTIIGD